MNTTKPREIDVRRAIMRLTLKPVEKLVLLATLDRVDWSTMAGDVPSSAIAQTLNHNRRSVVRALTALVDQDYIRRTSKQVTYTKSIIAFTELNVSLIMSASDEVSHSDKMSHSDEVSHSDEMSRGVVTRCPETSDEMSRGVVTRCHTINNYQYTINDQVKSDKVSHSDEMSLPTKGRLNAEMIRAIEFECNKVNDHSHSKRVQVAAELYRVKLMRGGYYESI